MKTQPHVLVFVAHNGPGPYPCSVCKDLVELLETSGSRGLAVHHRDENHENNEPSNLAAAHRGCHTRLHHLGREKSPAERQRLSESLTTEVRERIASSLRGKKRPPEVIAKIAKTWEGRKDRGLARTEQAEIERRTKIAAKLRRKA